MYWAGFYFGKALQWLGSAGYWLAYYAVSCCGVEAAASEAHMPWRKAGCSFVLFSELTWLLLADRLASLLGGSLPFQGA